MHRIAINQIYTTCRGGATSHYPETVVVGGHAHRDRTVAVHDLHHPGHRYTIPSSYFQATAETGRGTPRRTGYYLTGVERPY